MEKEKGNGRGTAMMYGKGKADWSRVGGWKWKKKQKRGGGSGAESCVNKRGERRQNVKWKAKIGGLKGKDREEKIKGRGENEVIDGHTFLRYISFDYRTQLKCLHFAFHPFN